MSHPSNIINFSPQEYGDGYREHVLRQYIMYVESAHKNSDNRHIMNRFCLALNTAFFGLLGIVFNKSNQSVELFWFVPVATSGIILCYAWYRFVVSYKALNSAKSSVINAIEEHLPLSLFSVEWEILESKVEGKKHRSYSEIEKCITWIFAIVYGIMILFASSHAMYLVR